MSDKLSIIVEFVQTEVKLIQRSIQSINASRSAIQTKFNSQITTVDQKIARLISSSGIAAEHRALVKEKSVAVSDRNEELKRLDSMIDEQNKIIMYLVMRLEQMVSEASESPD